MDAWLITWEEISNKVVEANKIAGILSSRTSTSDIEKLIEFIYHRATFNAVETVYYLNKRKGRVTKNKMLTSTLERIFYGVNPCLYARKVKELKVKSDELRNIEVVSWKECAIIENNESTGYTFKETKSEKAVSICRPLNAPLVCEPLNI